MCSETRPIIIAVEDRNILYLLRRYSQEYGFPAVSAWPATDVLDLAQSISPVLIILDGTQPETAQNKLLRALRSCPETRDIPIILYSAMDSLPQNWVSGVDVYLPKSVRYDDFVAALQHMGVRA